MLSLFLFASALGSTFSLALLWRLHRERSAVRRSLFRGGRGCRLLVLLERLMRKAIDRDLLAETGPGGLAEVALRFREPHDRFQNVAELLDRVAPLAGTESTAEMVQLVKYLYQLQHTLKLSPAELDGCLQEVVRRLLSGSYLGTPVRRVAIIREGEVLDRESMWPLNSGTRVKQAFGVALFDESGKVLDKAKVLCQ